VKSMLRGLCIVLALSGAITGLADTSGVPSVPSCAKIGVAYSEDRDTARSLPNGAYLADAKMCQQSCEVMLDCTHFTWKEDSFPGGACYLFKQLGKEEPDAKAISGPKACVSSEDSKVAQDMPTLPPVAVITPTVKPVAIERTDATGGDDHETLGAAPAATGGGSNMMTNALAGGAVAAIGIGGVAYYFIAGGKKSKSKKKSKRGVGVERAAEAMIADEAPAPAAPAPATGFEQYQGMMHPMGPQGPMTPVPQFYQQVPAYQPATAYTYQYPGIQVATPAPIA